MGAYSVPGPVIRAGNTASHVSSMWTLDHVESQSEGESCNADTGFQDSAVRASWGLGMSWESPLCAGLWGELTSALGLEAEKGGEVWAGEKH